MTEVNKRIDRISDDITQKTRHNMTLEDSKVSAHYDIDFMSPDFEKEREELKEAGVGNEYIDNFIRRSIKETCKQKYVDDFDRSFRPRNLSVEYDKQYGNWTCTVMD